MAEVYDNRRSAMPKTTGLVERCRSNTKRANRSPCNALALSTWLRIAMLAFRYVTRSLRSNRRGRTRATCSEPSTSANRSEIA
jgi:hypothetical protein